jgi:hypothetical protein
MLCQQAIPFVSNERRLFTNLLDRHEMLLKLMKRMSLLQKMNEKNLSTKIHCSLDDSVVLT